jgi:hypothetical protein
VPINASVISSTRPLYSAISCSRPTPACDTTPAPVRADPDPTATPDGQRPLLCSDTVALERSAFALRHLYVYPRLSIAYTYIPKNACTSFKRTFGEAEGWLSSRSPSAHEMRVSWWLRGLAHYRGSDEHIVVLRDPLDRVAGAYLDKFLAHKEPAAAQAMASGLGAIVHPNATPADVSFADFVRYLSSARDRDLNEHWRPQRDFLIGSYTRTLRFDRLHVDAAFLVERGLNLKAARGHSTSWSARDLGPGWGRKPARRLRRLRESKGVLPLRKNLYDEELTSLVAGRYETDIELLAALE